MYHAVLFQGDHMRVDQFPHDKHDLKVKIGILADRGQYVKIHRFYMKQRLGC